ncbi:MAG: hypothetical protein INF44_06850, partial [Thalassospira sp.]|nr:hypothetical protein [Thalassospira sp.]
MFQDSCRRIFLVAFSAHYFFFACMQGIALANPEGGVVVGGAASIAAQGNTTTITQTSDRAAINWNSFDIKAGETTEFKQPNQNS